MYAVIFRAEINSLDDEYSAMAEKMRDLAMNTYGCTDFFSSTDGNNEMAISYWENEAQIKEWKSNSEHLLAQSKGRSKWYKSYSVEVLEVVRAYKSNT